MKKFIDAIQPVFLKGTILRMLMVCSFLCVFAEGAQAKPAQWEYLVVNAPTNTRLLQTLLANQGLQGWELIQITDRGIAVFKRRK